MAPPSGNTSRPGLSLAVLAGLVLVLFLAIVGGGVVSPSAWSKDFRVQLGLDLTSGTTVSLQAVSPSGHPPSKGQMEQAVAIMLNRVNGAGFTEAQVQQQGSDVINVSVPGKSSQDVVKLVSKTAELQFRQVLLVAQNAPVPAPSPTAAPTALPTGSPQPSSGATPSASSSPSAAGLPGSGNGQTAEMASSAQNLRAATALAARSVGSSPSASPSPSASASPSASPSPTASTSTWQQAQGDQTLVGASAKALFNKLNCDSKDWQAQVGYTNSQWNNPNIQVVSCDSSGNKYVLDKAKVVGSMISSAKAGTDPQTIYWQVFVNFKSNGTKLFGQLTSAMFAKYGNGGNPTSPLDQLAIVLDGKVVTAPTIQSAIPGGQAQITGNFSQKSASLLANQLSYGALPLTFRQQSVQSVSPQLGRDQLHAGLVAAGLGLILVVFYLMFYYRGLAIVSMSSLIIAGTLSYESVIVLGKYVDFRLNLAGIAGLIVAIGITADSFVVFFERLRDEVRDGRSLRAAVERGWGRARRTILVSDTVSFLAAALLYYFAIGEVRGFAFTLGLTTIIDVIVVFTFTKPLLTLLARTKFFGGGHPLSGLDPRRLGARVPWPGASRGAERVPSRAGRTTSRTGSGRTSPAKEA